MTQVGLKRIHVAKLLTDTDEGTTYDVPRKISEAITANITPNVETATLYADDKLSEVDEALGDIDVEIGIKDLSVEDYAFLLGKTVDSDGGVTDNANDSAPYVALGFEVPLSGGRKRMYWYYKGKFSIPSSEHTTKQGSTEFQTPTISGKFMPRQSDEDWRYRLDSNETNAAVVDSWFTEVKDKPATIPTP